MATRCQPLDISLYPATNPDDQDASRFLQQSTARLNNNNTYNTSDSRHESRSRNPLDRRRPSAQGLRYVQRPGAHTPSHYSSASQQTRFPFASRLTSRADTQQAPLFYSEEEAKVGHLHNLHYLCYLV